MSTSRHSWNCPPDPAGATALGTASRAALLLPLLLAGCGGTESSKPNVLMIVMDTVRADHLGCYGGPRVTPNLDDLAAASTRYETCTASSPWTVPSHGSLFTGRDPHTHGAHSFDLERFEGVDNVFTLLESEVTLAEILATEGYATGGVVANAAYLKPAFGLNQGFEDWVISRMPAGDLNGRALEWIDSVDQGRPWFLFMNFMDAHRPYNVDPIEGEERIPQRESSTILLDQLYESVMVRGEQPGELGLKVREQYTRAIRNLDLALGELFSALRDRELWDDTVVVVTSDHGEYFGEHGLVEHSKDVYEPALDVPLLIKAPGENTGSVVTERTSNTHVPGLVIASIGGDVESRCGPQFPRLPGSPVMAENRYSRLRDLLHPEVGARFRRVRTAFYDDDWKLVRSSDGAHELYRLGLDPEEVENLAEREPEITARMLELVEAHMASTPFEGNSREQVGGEDHLRDLQGTGYAGDDR